MSKIVFTDPEALAEIIRFAQDNNCAEQLGLDLLRLIQCVTIGMTKDGIRQAEIGKDFAPHSMSWCVWNGEPDRKNVVLVGGWIYEGPGVPSDGSFPSLTVNLESITGSRADRPKHRWLVHT